MVEEPTASHGTERLHTGINSSTHGNRTAQHRNQTAPHRNEQLHTGTERLQPPHMNEHIIGALTDTSRSTHHGQWSPCRVTQFTQRSASHMGRSRIFITAVSGALSCFIYTHIKIYLAIVKLPPPVQWCSFVFRGLEPPQLESD